MIIDSKIKIYPSIFIHIPKCGGSSIKEMLQDLNETSDIHSKLKQDIDNLKKQKDKIERYFVFSFLRNPWDRMISYYFFYRDIIKTKEEIAVKAKKLDFHEWIFYIYEDPNKFNFIHDNYIDYLSYENKILADLTLNFHNFEKECIYLKEILKLKTPVLHINQTKHEDYKNYYSNKEIDVVQKIYKRDIDFFSFDFEETDKMKKIINEEKIEKIKKRKILF